MFANQTRLTSILLISTEKRKAHRSGNGLHVLPQKTDKNMNNLHAYQRFLRKRRGKKNRMRQKSGGKQTWVLTALTMVCKHYVRGKARDREVAFSSGLDRKWHSYSPYYYYPPLYYTYIKSRRVVGDRKDGNRHFTDTRILFNNLSARFIHYIHGLLICNY